MGNERDGGLKELQVVRLRRPVWVLAELFGKSISIRTELPTGLTGTVVMLNHNVPDKAYVEHIGENGGGFLFVIDVAELEAVET